MVWVSSLHRSLTNAVISSTRRALQLARAQVLGGVVVEHDGSGARRRSAGDKRDLLCSRAEVRRQEDGRAASLREGRRPSLDDQPRSCERVERSGAAGDGACVLAVRPRRTRPPGPPAALLAAVAQVFADVCQLRAAFAGQIAMPADRPGLNVPAPLDAHKRPVSGKEAFD